MRSPWRGDHTPYDGTACLGMLAEADLDPPLAVAAEGLRAALAELAP